MRNRRVSRRMARVTSHTLCFGGFLVALLVMTLLYILASTSGKRLMASIGEKERLLERLDEDYARESARWEEMLSPEHLERNLIRNGIAMRCPRADQVVRLNADGQPYRGQLSVARARGQASPNLSTANYRSRSRGKKR